MSEPKDQSTRPSQLEEGAATPLPREVSRGRGSIPRVRASRLKRCEGSSPLSKRALRNDSETYGPPKLCAWRVVPRVFWIQTTEPQFSRKLEKREDARRVEISGVNHFRRIFELRGSWRKIRRLIDRYLVSAGDQFSGDLRAQGASEVAGSINIAARSNGGRKGTLNGEGCGE